MEKKGKLLFVFFIAVVFLITTMASAFSEQGYQCLNNKINEKTCQNLSLEEKIFSVLSTGKCKKSLVEDSLNNNTCWGNSGECDVKLTAQAILALEETDTENSLYKSINWLSSQNETSSDLKWYLQINAPTNTNCSLNYSNNNYRFRVKQNEKLEHLKGNSPYFSIDPTGYKIEIREGYYNKAFTVSCTSSFETSFLFKKDNSLYISDLTKTGSANEAIGLKIDSLSFDNYESSLWATLALRKTHRDVSSFLPYLIAMSDDPRFDEYLPETFIYFLTDDESYSSELLSKQKEEKYWMESDNKFYDTAVALFPFANEDFSTKQNTTSWLEENQGEEGCWDNGNIVNTAFLLFSTGSSFSIQQEEGNETVEDCSSLGGFCMSDAACNESGGDLLGESGCSGWDICCNKEETETKCSDIGGIVCETGEECSGYYSQDVVESNCCVNGTCKETEESQEENETFTSECENYLGTCRTSCFENETIGDYSCVSPSDQCCITTQEEKSYLWLWIVLGILVLLAVAFIFRKKVVKFFKTKIFKKKGKKQQKGRKLPMKPRRPRPTHRPKIKRKLSKSKPSKPQKTSTKKQIPKTSQKPEQKQPQPKEISETKKKPQKQKNTQKKKQEKEPKDDIFKKLKEMGEE